MDLISFDEFYKCVLCQKKVETVNEEGICEDCILPDPCEDCQKLKCTNCKNAK